ncbi:BadF/BadG/BcrA/BcrD ATPase family protein [Pelagibacterium sp. H642]|uniref:N-acetylglucosamine kinase n=1 Tax=Pelagibacterium sp. H642 TaxID=1881069 RepID=UPI0028160A31|nr:BadF/BadG/BcrA/BcrD ATPase family protein [Pelagibacterium sp. H642]WMT92659.1 hypothetical protein NO934_20160 [Pelagibacterium sp. H642]
MSLVMGIDCGGSKSIAVLVDKTGRIADLTVGPGIDPTAAENFEAELASLLDALVPDGLSWAAATAGFPYFGEVSRFTAIETELASQKLGAMARPSNDVEIAHIGAFGGGEGVLCLAGTGSMAWAKGPKGTARAGGFGDIIGDEGSAFRIGQRALGLLSHEADGRRPRSAFGSALAQAAGIETDQLIEWTYSHANVRAGVAGLARYVSALAEQGDAEAQEILSGAGSELSTLALAAAKMAGLGQGAPLALAGSVFADPVVRAALTERYGADPIASQLSPAGGAALDAARRAGWHIDPDWIERLRDGLKQGGHMSFAPISNIKEDL